MAGETFQLRFRNNEDITVSIDEPINFATVDFQLSQKDKGYGRDVSFNGGETQFEFVKYRNHYLDKLLTYNKTYGFESIVELIITSGTISTIIGELDFATAITDDFEYFKCKVIQQSSKQVIKRRKAIKVDLLSSKDIDGNTITPLVPENVLLFSKPIYQISTWSQNEVLTLGTNGNSNNLANPAQYLNKYEIGDSYVPFSSDNYKIITVKNKLRNINIKVNNLSIYSYVSVNLNVKVIAKYGTTFSSATPLTIYDSGIINYTGSLPVINCIGTINSLGVNNSIWLYIQIYHEYNPVPGIDCFFDVSGMEVFVSAENTVYNSVVPAFRLINVMKQVIKSISGSEVSSVRFGTPLIGDFYNDFIFNGNSLRVLPNKPFYVSLEDIEKSIMEMNGDWEIALDGKVFFGIEDDFYSNIECGKFLNTQFSQMNKTFNPRFQINEFNYGYKKFQSLKENEEPNSADVIHGESKWVLANKSVENKKDISIEWTRDSFLIETNRRKSLEITEGTASQDDTDLFAIQAVANNSTTNMYYEPILSHSYSDSTLILSSTGDINFKVAGMVIGDSFQILSPTIKNIGTYVISSVSDSSLGLTLVSGSTPVGDVVPFVTYFLHVLRAVNTPYMMSRSLGFTNITNLVGSDTFANLRYSIRRNIENYWKGYLTTCNLYNRDKTITNSWYKNNNLFGATYLGLTLTENQPINTGLQAPILSPFIYNDVIFSNVEFVDFIALQDKIRTDRGYILTKDVNGVDLKLYPINMKYDNLSKELNIKGEEKFVPIFKPTVTTYEPIFINEFVRRLSGIASADGYLPITDKGIVWSLSQNPTVSLATKASAGTGIGSFGVFLSEFAPNSTYYVRAYATNANGTSYGSQVTFTTL